MLPGGYQLAAGVDGDQQAKTLRSVANQQWPGDDVRVLRLRADDQCLDLVVTGRSGWGSRLVRWPALLENPLPAFDRAADKGISETGDLDYSVDKSTQALVGILGPIDCMDQPDHRAEVGPSWHIRKDTRVGKGCASGRSPGVPAAVGSSHPSRRAPTYPSLHE